MAPIEENTVLETQALEGEARLLSEEEQKEDMNKVLQGVVYASQIKIRKVLFSGLAGLLGGALGMFGSHFIENWVKTEKPQAKASSELIAPIQNTDSESPAATQKELPFTAEEIKTMQDRLDEIHNAMNQTYQEIQQNLENLSSEK